MELTEFRSSRWEFPPKAKNVMKKTGEERTPTVKRSMPIHLFTGNVRIVRYAVWSWCMSDSEFG